MPQKKNAFFNFCFSCWPGAGQMYQGFMKRGVSIMTVFCGIVFLIAFFDADEWMVVIPIIWFYGFFDSMNTHSLPEEAFANVKDEFLFVDNSFDNKLALKKFRFPVGVLLVIVGIYWLCHSTLYALAETGFIRWNSRAFELLRYIPKTSMALVVMIIGVCLITGRRIQPGEKQENMKSENMGQENGEQGNVGQMNMEQENREQWNMAQGNVGLGNLEQENMAQKNGEQENMTQENREQENMAQENTEQENREQGNEEREG